MSNDNEGDNNQSSVIVRVCGKDTKMSEFGENLRKAREAKGITQQTLAEALFVTRQTVSRWENGSRYPDLLTARKISEVLGTSVGELLEEEDPGNIAERTPVTESPAANGVTAALYAGIVAAYISSIFGVILRLNNLFGLTPADWGIMAVEAFCELAGILIFAAGLFFIVRGELSSRKVGFITCAFWLICFIRDISKIAAPGSVSVSFVILISVPGAAAAMFTYLFYFEKCNAAYVRAALTTLSVWGILRTLYTLGATVAFAGEYVSTETALRAVLFTLVYALFIYQIYALQRKRRLAKGITADGRGEN